jgi:hypothetical protein
MPWEERIMPQIMLTEEQERMYQSASEPVRVCNRQGQVLGQLWPPVPNEAQIIAEAKRRLASGKPGVPAEQVHELLEALEREWQRLGGFDKDYMKAFVERFRASRVA